LQIFWHQKIAKPNVIREKLHNLLSYKKSVDEIDSRPQGPQTFRQSQEKPDDPINVKIP